ncbi:MAG: ASPIC/UnbV domain-containing protein, partial [Phycisphaerales bacterium]|nr:ASPIC/UnbV domain-containing protein [Phycisphaerales bacterium]
VVELQSNGVVQRRVVMPTRSYLSQVELPITFGLGKVPRVDQLMVVWPDGTSQHVDINEVDRMVEIRRE